MTGARGCAAGRRIHEPRTGISTAAAGVVGGSAFNTEIAENAEIAEKIFRHLRPNADYIPVAPSHAPCRVPAGPMHARFCPVRALKIVSAISAFSAISALKQKLERRPDVAG